MKGSWQRAREELDGAGHRQVRARAPNTAGLPGWREVGNGGGYGEGGTGEAHPQKELLIRGHFSTRQGGLYGPRALGSRNNTKERLSSAEQRERSRVWSRLSKTHTRCVVLAFPNP